MGRTDASKVTVLGRCGIAILIMLACAVLLGGVPAAAQEGDVVVENSVQVVPTQGEEASAGESAEVIASEEVLGEEPEVVVEPEPNGQGLQMEEAPTQTTDAPAASIQSTDGAQDDVALEVQGASSRGPNSAGALRVSGNRLVDKNGTPIQLRGVSTHGLAWYPDYVNDACFRQLRSEWNANVVRLTMYTAEYGGYCSGGNKGELTELVKKGVRLAANNDLYAIVDWHILSDNNPNMHVAEAKAFFADISSTFRNNTNVLYEICNEPNGGTSWNDIKQYANQVIPVIRKNDPDAVIIVGTPTWSQEIDKAAASPLSQGNVMYALHFYAATHKADLRSRLSSVVRGGLPVFVSEFGICDASGNGSIDQASANSWMSTINDLGVSWCMWSLCNKAESASILKSSCNATSGFRYGDLSTSGQWLLKALNGTLPPGTNDDSGGGADPTGGATTFQSGNFSCTLALTNSWDAGGGRTCYQYDLSIHNTGPACSSWSVSIPFTRDISFVNGWNATYAVQGCNLVACSMSYNGSIAAGGTVSGIGFQVSAAGGSSPAATTTGDPWVSYRTHVQKYGWQKYVRNGTMSGTTGKSKRLEGIKVALGGLPCSGGIQYRTHVQRMGWQGWRKDGKMSGTSGKSLRLEAIQIKLYGDMASRYDVYYRVHCQRFGWMGWAKNGERSGSAGYSRRLEGIQIVLVPKGQSGPGTSFMGVNQNVWRAFAQKGKK
ncbi:MAG: cellulase family glycosylhydrolase [Coriobacteriales bacterium]|nr:cellulase family glycosylhydrolase [Coriobacteriales bacterium]